MDNIHNFSGNARPYAFCYSTLNTDQITGTTNGVWLTLDFNTDVASLLNGIIDRPAVSQFRALKSGYYRISIKMCGTPNTTNRGWDYRIYKNGTTQLVDGYLRTHGADVSENRGTNTVGCSIIAYLNANDYIQVQANPLQGVSIDILAESSMTFELVTLI